MFIFCQCERVSWDPLYFSKDSLKKYSLERFGNEPNFAEMRWNAIWWTKKTTPRKMAGQLIRSSEILQQVFIILLVLFGANFASPQMQHSELHEMLCQLIFEFIPKISQGIILEKTHLSLQKPPSSWWFSNPIEKYLSNWIISPGRGENRKKPWNHHHLDHFLCHFLPQLPGNGWANSRHLPTKIRLI